MNVPYIKHGDNKTRFFDTYCRVSEHDLNKFLQEYEVEYSPLEGEGQCYDCKDLTYFKENNFGYHVCSLECLAALDKALTETYNQLAVPEKVEDSLLDLEGNKIIDIKYGKIVDGMEHQSAVIILDKEGKKRLFCDFDEDFLRHALAISDGDII